MPKPNRYIRAGRPQAKVESQSPLPVKEGTPLRLVETELTSSDAVEAILHEYGFVKTRESKTISRWATTAGAVVVCFPLLNVLAITDTEKREEAIGLGWARHAIGSETVAHLRSRVARAAARAQARHRHGPSGGLQDKEDTAPAG